MPISSLKLAASGSSSLSDSGSGFIVSFYKHVSLVFADLPAFLFSTSDVFLERQSFDVKTVAEYFRFESFP
jgi:hypothetical protein